MDLYQQKKNVLRRIGITLLALLGISFLLVVVFYQLSEQMGTMIFALLIGGVGALVSFFLRFPRMTELELQFITQSWWAVIVPTLIGLVMGGLIYIVFFAGILTGDGGDGLFTSNLFPKFINPEKPDDNLLDLRAVLQIRPDTVQDFGKLLVWCFLSGYSERFVPNLLQGLERRGGIGTPAHREGDTQTKQP